METIKLNNGKEMPVLGLGTWQLTGAECTESVKKAVEMGYTHIDTARIYGNEKEIGKALKEIDKKRSELFITSKVPPSDLDYSDVIRNCEEALNDLGTGYLDLLLIHWPNRDKDMKETLKAFKKLIDEGKIRAFGVSNFTIHHIKDMMPIAEEVGIKIANNQVEFHPGLYQKELLDFCKDNRISVTAYSPIARGDVMQNGLLGEIGDKYGKTEAQVSLRWLYQRGLIAIPKASSEEHMKENMDIFDFELDEADMKRIDSLGNSERKVRPGHAEFDY